MDTGKRNCDNRFYEGYEGEPELVLFSEQDEMHIWDGYMEDIFGNPVRTENGWIGFTRDFNEFVGPYADDCIECALDITEYLQDALQYRGHNFEYEESKDVLEAIITLLEQKKEKNEDVAARVL